MKPEISKKEKVDKHVDKLIEAQELRHSKYYTWMKNIITLAIGFLGIIVSLKSDNLQNYYQYIFFVFTISLLVLGILSGTLVLYSEIDLLNKKRQFEQVNLGRVLNDEKIIKHQAINRRKIYDISEYVCIFSFVLSLISIIVYSTLSDYETTKKEVKTETKSINKK